MLIDLASNEYDLVRHLFESHKRGRAMIFGWMDLGLGSIKTDSKENPTVAYFLFTPMSFLAGDASSSGAKDIIRNFPSQTIAIVPDENWNKFVQSEWGEKIRTQHRTKLSADSLDIDYLRKIVESLPPVYTLQKIDLDTLNNSAKTYWSALQYFFGSFEKFLEDGWGYCIKKGDQTVSVAYTAFPFSDDFEIQVETLDDSKFRRKGLATIVCAALIEDALLKGITPNWDAANQPSVHLALKLGYTNPDPYDVYYWLESP
ncbi:MAG: GNAT family N-acetyltransferase [Candidatus Thorarchaeota archaeon]|nr:GNAT family N-acetyltransferase [Candidatus Thorarchaeota archaeon]